MAKRKQLRTDICWSTEDKITIKGLDLCQDIMGKVSLGDMAFLEMMDRLPNERESRVFNALAVILVEHGMTPSAIVTRMTLAGAPEAMQAAVAAGLSGLGSVFVGSMENAARMLQEALPDPARPGDIAALAARIVDEHAARARTVPGIGHHIHKPVDPRAPRLFEIARDNGFDGPYVALMQAVAETAQSRLGKSLPVNATGAIAAVASELGIPWRVVRGIGVMSRAIGLVAHVLEELREPMAREIKAMVEEEATAHLR
ncbi:citryl-CoA lyase [Pigmentiphaga daeguensis]|uniref:citrate synthase (unknown stereospecificity) n=1 Tax=Pigmentiphaga daeguensis TaxID=414049 RepID=A0ABN1CT36_9BURK